MSPSWITSPATTLTSWTVPARSASTGISIFIDSSSITVSPISTSSPGATATDRTLATISARICDVEEAMAATLPRAGCYSRVRSRRHSVQRLEPAPLGPVRLGLLVAAGAPAVGARERLLDPDHDVPQGNAGDHAVD